MQITMILIKNGITNTVLSLPPTACQTQIQPMNLAATSIFPTPPMAATTLSLVDLPLHQVTIITSLREAENEDAQSKMLQRLAELGFMAGETISVLQRGPGGREPIAVQVGDTVFALRRHEASAILVKAPT